MSSSKFNKFVSEAKEKGFTVDLRYESAQGEYRIEVRKDNRAVQCIVDMNSYVHGGETLMIDSVSKCMNMLDQETQGAAATATGRDLMRVSELERELDRYKAAVKQLSFDLEMAQTPPKAVATEADVRKQTLEMAADFLMDYGVIKTGTELESVCNQMKKLHPSRKAVIQSALEKMDAAFGSRK